EAGMAGFRPMTGGQVASVISFPGDAGQSLTGREVQGNRIDPDFFKAMGMPRLLGRPFGPQDSARSPKVAIVNETFAQSFFADQNPIGQRFGFGRTSEYIEIVGVVRDAKYHDLREKPIRMAYIPYVQEQPKWLGRMHYIVRTNRPQRLASAIRQL